MAYAWESCLFVPHIMSIKNLSSAAFKFTSISFIFDHPVNAVTVAEKATESNHKSNNRGTHASKANEGGNIALKVKRFYHYITLSGVV